MKVEKALLLEVLRKDKFMEDLKIAKTDLYLAVKGEEHSLQPIPEEV